MPSQIAVAQFKRIATALRREEDGQDLLEYGLLCALIAVVAIGALLFLGGQINAILSAIGNAI